MLIFYNKGHSFSVRRDSVEIKTKYSDKKQLATRSIKKLQSEKNLLTIFMKRLN